MCLSVTFRCEEKSISEVEREFQDGSTLFVAARTSVWKQKKSDTFNVSDLPGGKACACGLLGEGSSWETDTWALNSALLPLLRSTVLRFHQVSKGNFTFDAVWSRKEPSSVVKVTITELTTLIDGNRIGTDTRYQVGR